MGNYQIEKKRRENEGEDKQTYCRTVVGEGMKRKKRNKGSLLRRVGPARPLIFPGTTLPLTLSLSHPSLFFSFLFFSFVFTRKIGNVGERRTGGGGGRRRRGEEKGRRRREERGGGGGRRRREEEEEGGEEGGEGERRRRGGERKSKGFHKFCW